MPPLRPSRIRRWRPVDQWFSPRCYPYLFCNLASRITVVRRFSAISETATEVTIANYTNLMTLSPKGRASA